MNIVLKVKNRMGAEGRKKENVFAICTSVKKKAGGGNPETTEIDLIQGVGRNG